MKNLLKLVIVTLLLSSTSIFAQTFSGSNGTISDNSCDDSNIFTTEVSGIGILGNAKDFFEVVINIEHSYDPDLDIFLIAPDGTLVELSTDNGGGWFQDNDNYTDTHFKSEAIVNIVDGEAPFTGDFKPEGDFSDLNGINADGIWKLKICDDSYFNSGTLESWEITFSDKLVIPIKLSNFRVVNQNNYNQISWETFSEVNTDVFIIEHSLDLNNWDVISEINAAGNSKEFLNYSIIDYTPFVKTYYRLTILDLDGKREYSNIIFTNSNLEHKCKIFPNPSKGRFKIMHSLNSNDIVNITIINQRGEVISNKNILPENEIINEEYNLRAIDGIYNVLIKQNKNSTSKKIIIRN